jgi:hypothetical protein
MGPGEHYFCLENREGKVLEVLMMTFAYYSSCHFSRVLPVECLQRHPPCSPPGNYSMGSGHMDFAPYNSLYTTDGVVQKKLDFFTDYYFKTIIFKRISPSS